MGKKYMRKNGESMPQFQARIRADQAKTLPPRGPRNLRKDGRWRLAEREEAARKRAADRVDGYDRDDLGESPDF